MSLDAYIVLAVILGAVVLFITEWLPIDLVGILIIVSLTITGVNDVEESLSGFSNAATITVAYMFVIS